VVDLEDFISVPTGIQILNGAASHRLGYGDFCLDRFLIEVRQHAPSPREELAVEETIKAL
jgi:hypothetical protein